jgi:CheY-like chemotaxis protein
MAIPSSLSRTTKTRVSVVLTGAGATVVAAATAREVMTEFLRATLDVLVADIDLPEEDGYALLQGIHEVDPGRGATPPAIALTTYATESDRRAIVAGFQRHVVKPIDPHELVLIVPSLVE